MKLILPSPTGRETFPGVIKDVVRQESSIIISFSISGLSRRWNTHLILDEYEAECLLEDLKKLLKG